MGFGGFVNFTIENGLAHNQINRAIYRDSDGVLWVGTDGSGVALYDGTAWSSLDTRDGLAGNTVSSIHQASDGSLWFGYDCLAKFLHVEYECEADDSPKLDFLEIVIPEELLEKLKEAAEICNITKLTDYLGELESLGIAGERLAEHLRAPVRKYDMETILTILSQIRNDQ